MDKLAKKYPRLLNFLSYISIFTGFSGMAFIFYFLIKGTYNLLVIPNAVPLLAPVLPGVEIPGLPILSFWHWIIAILFVATIHEFSHGVYARLCDTKIKSSGFAFLGPILAAFVELDEKQILKKTKKQQLAILSAGPFSNIVAAFIILILTIFIINPIASAVVSQNGVQVNNLEKNFPADLSGITIGEEILSINNISIQNPKNFSYALKDLKPNDEVLIRTNISSYNIKATENPNDKNKGYLGIIISAINVSAKENIRNKYGNLIPMFILWISELFFWLYAINLGIGLFNLLPLGPVDGGRMFSTLISYFIKNKKIVQKIFLIVTLFCLLLIFINLLPYIIKLIYFILKPILLFLF
ncbi:MAG: M50 family metallopeptidase [Nanoarchaeota archaeon]|nr:M50 family metallopeptidase [Nanoarchaeota archaeon]